MLGALACSINNLRWRESSLRIKRTCLFSPRSFWAASKQQVCRLLLFLVPPSPSEAGFLDDSVYHSAALGPGYDRPFQFDPSVREPKTIQLYKHLNLKSCVWTFDAYYDMTELIDVCGGSVTADFQVGLQGLMGRVRVPGCHVKPVYS